ncbi:MAG: DegT/DnrJ/EryC1/StrS family aminotransferase [Abditibacteriales bacterium]|nr:DegT/DnrJ/EryC1/StrS family aminotransferase [Abditibacteriales bacterium]MDW8365253.1 DegT/DnrJ/EryC1/StrS family aminotransferase [Abditibacteriales bacterium]
MPVRTFNEREIELLHEVLASGRLSSLAGGTFVPRFEAAFAQAVGARHAVAMNAAMSVLHAAVAAAGAGAGDEVICDPVCVFGAVATMYNNAVPVFVDIDPVTMNMNPDLIEAKITERTKALIVTHVWGLPAEMDRIVAVAHQHGLVVIEDCAHALFATYKGKQVGTWGDIGSFSFQMSKQMALGDGGMGVTDNEGLAKALDLHGGAPTFLSVAHGLHWNYRMTEQTAAIGLVQLERARGYVQELIEIGRLYDAAVRDCAWLTVQRAPYEAQHTYHFWAAVFWGDKQGIPLDDFQRVLREEECSVSIGYTGMPAYKHPLIHHRLGYGRGCPLDCPLYAGNQNHYPDGLCPVAEEVIPRVVLAYTFSPQEHHQRNAEALHRAVTRLSG